MRLQPLNEDAPKISSVGLTSVQGREVLALVVSQGTEVLHSYIIDPDVKSTAREEAKRVLAKVMELL